MPTSAGPSPNLDWLGEFVCDVLARLESGKVATVLRRGGGASNGGIVAAKR